ncbi:MAG: hypothetical protein OCD03_02785 [Hyphomicrobiales bacterium]
MDMKQKNNLRNKIYDILNTDLGQDQMVKEALFLTVQCDTNEVIEALVRESAITTMRLRHMEIRIGEGNP